MSKQKKHNVRCVMCDWELKGTHKITDGWQCPKCNGPVVDGTVNK